MMNKKLIALFVAIAGIAAGSISANYCDYHDCDRRGVVRGTVGVADDVAVGTIGVADDIATGTVDTTVGRGSILNPGNWGREGREKRREAREDRRNRRYYRD
jgi:hypothetical protein